MNRRAALHEVMKTLPGGLALGVLDIGSGQIVFSTAVDGEAKGLELCAAAAMELFGQAGSNASEEIVVVSEDRVHFLRRLSEGTQQVFAVICRADVNLGEVIARSRAAVWPLGIAA